MFFIRFIVFHKVYIKGLKNGIKEGRFSSRHEGQLEALRMVLGITRTEERKIMKELMEKSQY